MVRTGTDVWMQRSPAGFSVVVKRCLRAGQNIPAPQRGSVAPFDQGSLDEVISVRGGVLLTLFISQYVEPCS
jgi:hypothetical protein